MENNDSLRYYFSCSIAPQMYPIYGAYRTIMISSFVVDAFLFVAIVPINFLTFFIIIKNKELRTPPNLCLLSISVCDFAVGLISIPMFTWNFLLALDRRHNCDFYIAMYSVIHYLFIVSNSMVFMIIVDRYIAILYPFRYHTFDKVARYSIAIAIIWISSFCFVLFVMVTPTLFVLNILETVAYFGVFIFILISQLRIRKKVQIAKIKICQTTVPAARTTRNNNNNNNNNKDNNKKTLHNPTKTQNRKDFLFFSIVSTNFLCYVPFAVCALNWAFVGDADWVQTLNTWAFTTATAKSLLNPLMYFYSMKKMRQGLKKFCQRKPRIVAETLQIQQHHQQQHRRDNIVSCNISPGISSKTTTTTVSFRTE